MTLRGSTSPGPSRLVVVGGDAAGMSAASQARRLAPDLEIVVLEAGDHVSYAACGLPLLVSGEVTDPTRLLGLTPEIAREQRGLDVRTGTRVTGIDRAGCRVHLSGAGTLPFDRLVLATGARPLRPALPGVDLEGIHALRHLDHGLALHRDLTRAPRRRAVVAGAGYVGLDVAEALRRRGLAVTLIKRTAGPLLGLEPELGALAEEALTRGGCLFLRDAPLYGLEGAGRVAAVHAGGERLAADLVVLALGIEPATELAREAGLSLGPGGAVAVDAFLATSAAGILAAGDCATQRHRVTGQAVHLPQALGANRQGRIAGANAALDLLDRPGRRTDPGTLGTAMKRLFDVELAHTGLSLAAARAAGREAFATVITARTRPGYTPGSGVIKVALITERGTGRLLGGQIAGASGSAKRIDVLATALSAGLDVAALADLDLGYTPVLSPLWDPLLVAARLAARDA
jgi:NADPH-dependent 2,4-dienoyl-CoA reductase/sulfur reductase-like enzyme